MSPRIRSRRRSYEERLEQYSSTSRPRSGAAIYRNRRHCEAHGEQVEDQQAGEHGMDAEIAEAECRHASLVDERRPVEDERRPVEIVEGFGTEQGVMGETFTAQKVPLRRVAQTLNSLLGHTMAEATLLAWIWARKGTRPRIPDTHYKTNSHAEPCGSAPPRHEKSGHFHGNNTRGTPACNRTRSRR